MKVKAEAHLLDQCVCVRVTISLHGGITHAQAAPEAQLPQEASTTLRNVLHNPPLRVRKRDRCKERERERDDLGHRTEDQL